MRSQKLGAERHRILASGLAARFVDLDELRITMLDLVVVAPPCMLRADDRIRAA